MGIVDLSTSHPGIFAPILADLGMPVGVVLVPESAPRERTEDFLRDHPGVVSVSSLDELADVCDVAMLLGGDWDQRMDQVRSLVAQGIPVFADKPMAGTVGELFELASLADSSARIDGGSALRVAPEALAVRESGVRPTSVEVTCVGHPFYYGVHALALATAVLGPGLVSARAVTGDLAESIEGVIEHVSGAAIRVAVSRAGAAGGFRATVRTSAGVTEIEPAADAFHAALIADVMPRLATPTMPRRPGRELVECELALLALAWSVVNGGADAAIDSVPADFRPWRGAVLAR